MKNWSMCARMGMGFGRLPQEVSAVAQSLQKQARHLVAAAGEFRLDGAGRDDAGAAPARLT